VPLFTTIELTLKCNLHCVHCYNFDRSAPMPVGEELRPEEILALLDELAAAGCLEVSFSGGEALLHPHLDDFVIRAREHLCAVRLKTNAMALTEVRAKRLNDLGVYTVDVSLYGASPATHDAFTTLPGSFLKTLAGARTARDAGMRVSLSFCLTRHNATEIGAMVALAETEGMGYTIDPQLTARYDGTTSSLDHRVDHETLEALYRGPLAEAVGQPTCRLDTDLSCSCARAVAAVSSTGEVYPCIGAPLASGNVRDGGFTRVWRESPVLNRIRGLGLDDYPKCGTCPDRGFCRRSNGVTYVNTGDYTGADPWTCGEAAILRRIAEDQ
jgi:radical SAM protein with 4Fe4S-binding SPASM domain